MIRNYSLSILIYLSFSSFFGQSIQNSNEINSSFPTCGFDHLRSILLQDSDYLRKEIDAEQKIAQYISQSQLRSSSSIYTIPVVVHILHLGETVGVGTNISDAQIQSAIANLNDVYRGQTAGSPVDFEIEFALAQQDPNCIAHSGINRINASSVPNYSSGGVDFYGDGGEADQNVLKNLSRWPETEYFNIWIVSEIENNNGGFGIQGYANFFTGSAMEGSVMMASVFGFDPTNAQPSFNLNTPRDNSTVVHEIGHYLHLHHTFKGDGDADDDGIGDACPGDITIGVDSDGCADTEPHKRYTSQCKSGLLNDCTGATFGDNTAKNFMSYASCQDRLTYDQKTRSRAMLATTGISLIYSKGDEAPVNYSTVIANANCSPQTSPLGLSGAYTGIKNFTIDGIFTNTSSWSDIDGGYVDNTFNCQKVINVFEDNSYNFEVSTLYNANNIKGYIDYNNDGNFLDANELIFDINTADNMSGDYVSSAAVNITIPTSNGTSIVSGTKLRLRLNSDIGIVANACEAPQYGQVEDYTIIINELVINLTADFSSSDSIFCQGTNVTFTDLSTGTPTSWAWDFGDGNTSSLQNPSHTYASVGTYDVSLTVTTSTGSESETKNGFITVNSNPNINAGIDQTICDGSSTTLNATSGQNYVTGVTAAGASDYILSGAFSGNDPAINISLGDTLTFNVNSPGHPFLIKTTNTTGTANAVTVTNNGTSSGTIIWSPTSSGTYYYICEYHAGMVGTITVGASNVNYTWDNNIPNGTGFTPTSTNTYTVTGTDGNGCTSTDNVIVNLIPNSTGIDVISSCNNYTWIDGITYTSNNNTATDTLTNVDGCDSIVTLDLTITSSGTAVNDTACDSYSWKGNTINTSGTYFNSNGSCLEILNLVVDYTSNSYLNIVACDEYVMNGNTYTSSGMYYDTLQTLHGCDSSVTLDLIVNYSSNSLNTVISCNDYLWNGDLYTNSGFYIDTLQSISGCDSLATLSIIIKDATVDTITVNSCDFYFWRGNTYNQSGIYRDTLQSVLGCDSILLLDLILDNPTFTYDSVTSCQHYLWNGNNYTLSGIYTDSLLSSSGCDSIVTLSLSIINSFQGDTLEISSCDEFLWQGNQYTQTGLFSDTLISNIGCDSIIYLNLTISNSFEIDEYVNACISYNWNGKTYSVSGVYTDTLEASFGCDSIINLILNISSNQIFSETIVSCESYLWNGIYLDSSGQYIDTLQAIGGCDSTIILDLTIYEIAFVNDSVNDCEYYDWNGVRYTSSGVYLDTIQSSNGCDSIVLLDLNLFTVYQDTIFASACDSFLWYGNTYTVPGIYTNTFTTINGCDSVEVLNFSINNNNNNSPIDFELVLDDYCLETHWNIVSSDGVVVHQEGPYDCNINGSGLQSNQTINRSLSLEEQSCYKFTLYDDFGDGLGASQWGGIDGSWLLNDLNGNSLSQGQGNFGDSISVSFYINEDFSTSIIENENNFSKIIAYPNPFISETEIQIINFEDVYDVSIRDIQGKLVHKLNNLSDNYFTLKSSSISSGVYWVVLDNHPKIKPLKLVVQ